VDLPVLDRSFDVSMTPFQIRTFRVPRDATRDIVEVDLLERPVGASAGE
jgi:alpha-mannosidase